MNPETELSKVVETLCKALAEDKSEGSYYFGWQANIAMAFYDSYNDFTPSLDSLHEMCNDAAKKFLNLLIATTLNPQSLNHE